MTQTSHYIPGLEGVIAAQTKLSRVDGLQGELIMRGHHVAEISARASMTALCHLLWEGRWPDATQEEILNRQLGQARQEVWHRIDHMGDALAHSDAMDALRACVAHLSVPDEGKARVLLTAAIPVFAAAWRNLREGIAPIAPDPSLPHAQDVARLFLRGKEVKASMEALQSYLVTVADHGMNASTFTARVVASTGSDPVSAVVAAIGALKGPLHGGAPGPVLDMLDAIGQAAQAQTWLKAHIDKGERIMGMGHRVYRVRDPRAAALENALEEMEALDSKGKGRLHLARTVEKVAEALLAQKYPQRPLRANVEFYTATLLEALQIPRDMFTAVFCTGRVVGWCAHIEEQVREGKMLRPKAEYIGQEPQ